MIRDRGSSADGPWPTSMALFTGLLMPALLVAQWPWQWLIIDQSIYRRPRIAVKNTLLPRGQLPSLLCLFFDTCSRLALQREIYSASL